MSYHSSHCVSVPAMVCLYQGGRMMAMYERCSSMSLARQVASYLRRHHLVGPDVEVRIVRV